MKIKIKLNKPKEIIRENIASKSFWYNGSSRPRLTWTTESVGNGNDQHGPGLYFTTSEQDAKSYGLYVHKVNLRLKQGRICPITGKLKIELVQSLIQQAPNVDSLLENWDENPAKALRLASQSIMKITGKFEMLQQIWYDFYRYQPKEFLKNVSAYFDGAIVSLPEVKHAIIFNPEIIKTISTTESGYKREDTNEN